MSISMNSDERKGRNEKKIVIGCVPLSADPPTLAHVALLEAALGVADRLIWAIGINPEKKNHFTLEQRLDMLREVVRARNLDNRVSVQSYTGATLRFAQQSGANLLVRGIRSVADFQSEFELAAANRSLPGGMETCFFMCEPAHSAISATRVRELLSLGESIQGYVPESVAAYISGLKN